MQKKPQRYKRITLNTAHLIELDKKTQLHTEAGLTPRTKGSYLALYEIDFASVRSARLIRSGNSITPLLEKNGALETRYYAEYFLMTSVAFVPPKPKLFDITVFSSVSRISVTISKPCAASSSVSMLMLGATKPWFNISAE